MPQLVNCFEMPLRMRDADLTLPRTYIYCKHARSVDIFSPFAERAKSERGWRYYEIDASHSPQTTAPETLAVLSHEIVSGRA